MTRETDAPPLVQDKGRWSGESSTSAAEATRLRLSDRDASILLALALKVRCFDSTLVAKAWWEGTSKADSGASQRLRALVREKWLCSASMFAHDLPDLKTPLVVWEPGTGQPDFGPIAYRLKTRFDEPAKVRAIYWASAKTMTRFGGGQVRRPRSSEVSHDLGLAAVYLTLLKSNPDRAKQWVSEAKILARGTSLGVKVPDAVLREGNGKVTAIEFGGEYSKAKLIAFHRYCEAEGEGYELW